LDFKPLQNTGNARDFQLLLQLRFKRDILPHFVDFTPFHPYFVGFRAIAQVCAHRLRRVATAAR